MKNKLLGQIRSHPPSLGTLEGIITDKRIMAHAGYELAPQLSSLTPTQIQEVRKKLIFWRSGGNGDRPWAWIDWVQDHPEWYVKLDEAIAACKVTA